MRFRPPGTQESRPVTPEPETDEPETDEPETDEPDAEVDDEADDEREPTAEEIAEAEAHLGRLAAALANLDDDSLRRGLASMREQTRLEVAQHLNLSRATMHLGDALVPLVRRKIATAGPARQLAVGFAISEACNDATIAALGDRHDEPTREDMDLVLPDIVAEQGAAMVSLMLASYGASDAQCQPVFAAILAEDERFALPEVADFSIDESADGEGPTLVTRSARTADDPEQAAKREERKVAKAAKREAEAQKKAAKDAAQAARREAQHRSKQKRAAKH
jgi:hypothetical protein